MPTSHKSDAWSIIDKSTAVIFAGLEWWLKSIRPLLPKFVATLPLAKVAIGRIDDISAPSVRWSLGQYKWDGSIEEQAEDLSGKDLVGLPQLVLLPSDAVYTQALSLPIASKRKRDVALSLMMSELSPIPQDRVLFDHVQQSDGRGKLALCRKDDVAQIVSNFSGGDPGLVVATDHANKEAVQFVFYRDLTNLYRNTARKVLPKFLLIVFSIVVLTSWANRLDTDRAALVEGQRELVAQLKLRGGQVEVLQSERRALGQLGTGGSLADLATGLRLVSEVHEQGFALDRIKFSGVSGRAEGDLRDISVAELKDILASDPSSTAIQIHQGKVPGRVTLNWNLRSHAQ